MSIRRRLSAVAVAAGMLAVSAPLAGATTRTVTNTNDSGPGSLRATVAAASANDTISIPAGTYTLASQISFSKPLDFEGASARTTVIDGGGTTRLFQINTMLSGQTIFSSLKLTHGSAASGGAIDAHAAIVLSHVAIVGNTATSGSGGGVNATDMVTMTDSLVNGNSAPNGSGGGIELAPSNSVVSEIDSSTIVGNGAHASGGGLDQSTASSALLDLTQNTFADNVLSSVTSAGGNFAITGGPAPGGSSTFSMYGNVFVRGVAATHVNCTTGTSIRATGSSYNVEDGDLGCLDPSQYDRWVLDPLLSELSNNGGQTDTMMPDATSPLVDQVPTSGCLPVDQRDVARPRGSQCDDGAAER
jgi:hypothetical protein